MRDYYDIIVIGGGHAGTEAAWAGASILRERGNERGEAGRVALITMDPSRIGQMSCNPAIGGLGKGQMVREIDALGGIMGRAIDATGIMFKMLNTSKGAAVRGPRAQADKYAYAAEVQRLIASAENIDVIAATVDDIIVENGEVVGVLVPEHAHRCDADQRAVDANLQGDSIAQMVFLRSAQRSDAQRQAGSREATEASSAGTVLLRSRAIILTTGTFMRGLMHTGEERTQGGRVEEGAAVGISHTLRTLGFELGRLKTGTPPRLARESLDWDALDAQLGDEAPTPFSDLSPDVLPASRFPHLAQIACRVTQTTAEAHELIRMNLDRAPMYSGQIDAETGPRYCPSIEDKVVRFADRDSHHVFLEPESLHTNEIYANGISTSLPIDVQERLVHTMPGCEHAVIQRWGYAVEYDMVWPHQIDSTSMTKSIRGLFLAGQINCTTGYEEAGAQGLIAGLNAARLVRGEEAVRLGRDQAYIGVMMDDLVTKPPREPYRMFTSRAEHRLLLRAETADARLTPVAREIGLVDDARWRAYEQRTAGLDAIRTRFDAVRIAGKPLRSIARRPDVSISDVQQQIGVIDGQLPQMQLIERVITEAKYDGYITRQAAEIKRQQSAEQRSIPEWINFHAIHGLRSEAAQTLTRFRPQTMGQAGRLPGVNPADLTLLAVHIKRGRAAMPQG